MARLLWGDAGERVFQTGVDRGVLYLKDRVGVPWNGLISVSEKPSGGEPRPYYLDGVKYINTASREEFNAAITAYTYPDEFGVCDGTSTNGKGLFYSQQKRETFGLTYRTKIGNDLDGLDHGYKIHLIYNALALPTESEYTTLNAEQEASAFNWEISTQGVSIPGKRATAHLTLDSRKVDPVLLQIVEGILYGHNSMLPRLPEPSELDALFDNWQTIDYQGKVNFKGNASSTKVMQVTNYKSNSSFEEPASYPYGGRSSDWASEGVYSLAIPGQIQPRATDTVHTIVDQNNNNGMTRGKTYVVMATYRRIAFMSNQPSILISGNVNYDRYDADNTPDQRVKQFHFTTPPIENSGNWSITMEDTSGGNYDTIWWDCVGIFDDHYEGEYFDGNTSEFAYKNNRVKPIYVGVGSSAYSQFNYVEDAPPLSNGDMYLVSDSNVVYCILAVDGLWTNVGLIDIKL